jgi:hypothetical protein
LVGAFICSRGVKSNASKQWVCTVRSAIA